MRITQLGAGVDKDARLSSDAIERTLDVLHEYSGVLDRFGVAPGRVRIAATSAARDAANREDFFDAVEAIVGARPELLSGDQEARLTFAGASPELDPADGLHLVVDIGGGSTELIVGTPGREPDGAVSVDLGCLRLTEQYLHHDPPRAEELSAALSVVHDTLEDVARELPTARQADRFVGLAGTVTTAAAVEMGLAAYDRDRLHHFELRHDAAEDVFRSMAMGDREDRLGHPGLEAARADVIVGGLCVLVSVYRFFGFATCLVSETDILDGLAATLLDGWATP